MSDSTEHIDRPEPRWQALVALLAVGAIYLALPRSLIIGPIWLLPTLIVVLLVPTVVSHRAGKRSLNRALGIIINGITTTALIGSVILLVRALPSHSAAPAFFSRRCRSHMTSVANLHVRAGGRASSIISSLPSPRVLRLVRLTRRCWRVGQKFSR